MLSKIAQSQLLQIAQNAIESAVRHTTFQEINEQLLAHEIKLYGGAFVTIRNNKELRGCIGRFPGGDTPLYKVVKDVAISAATHDTRFRAVSSDELFQIDIEISVLSPLQAIHNIDELIIGKHGIYTKYGYKTGVLLPQVATEMNWNAEEFISYCAEKKAKMTKEEAQKAELFVFESEIFHLETKAPND